MTTLRQSVIEMIKDVCRPDPVDLSDPARPLMECGLDSLHLASVFIEIEDKFKIKLPKEDLDGLYSVDAMVAYIEGRTPS